MSDLVEFPVAGGGTVLVSATHPAQSDGAIFRGGGPRDVVIRSAETLQAAIAQL